MGVRQAAPPRAPRAGRPRTRMRGLGECLGGKRDSIRHHPLEVTFETATAPELRRASFHTPPPLGGGSGGGGGGGGGV